MTTTQNVSTEKPDPRDPRDFGDFSHMTISDLHDRARLLGVSASALLPF